MVIGRGNIMNVSFDIPAKLLDKVDILLERVPYLSESISGMIYCKDKHVVELSVNDSQINSKEMNELRESYQDLCSSLENTRVIKERVVKSNLAQDNYTQSQANMSYSEYSYYI